MEAINEVDLPFLRAGFDSIRGGSKPAKAQLDDYLKQVAGAVELSKRKRGLQLELIPEWTGVGSVVGYALGLLIDRRYNASQRLGKCKKKECGKYFFDPHTGPGRFRTDFCSTAHNDAYAQRAKRKRDRAKTFRQQAERQRIES